MYLKVKLMFSDLLSLGGSDKFLQSATLKEINDAKVEFKSVSLRKYHLRNIKKGI